MLFYNKYFTDWNEIQTMVFFMKLYSTIEDEYTIRLNKQISDSDMLIVLQAVMNNDDTRKYALTLFQDYIIGGNLDVYIILWSIQLIANIIFSILISISIWKMRKT